MNNAADSAQRAIGFRSQRAEREILQSSSR